MKKYLPYLVIGLAIGITSQLLFPFPPKPTPNSVSIQSWSCKWYFTVIDGGTTAAFDQWMDNSEELNSELLARMREHAVTNAGFRTNCIVTWAVQTFK